jgi:glutamate-ammonia-ligase adenylyltransferase
MHPIVEAIDFRHRERALANLSQLLNDMPERVQALVRVLLGSAADPDSALDYLERLHRQQPAAFFHIARSPATLRAAITVFSHSRFLSEEILQHPDWIEPLVSSGDLHRSVSPDELADRLDAALEPEGLPSPLTLALFKRRQILRVLLRDVLGHSTLSETTAEISHVADAILDISYRRIRQDLARRFGIPRLSDGRECGFSVIALGKLGGNELNYSSDIDLMFVYAAPGETDGPHTISNKEFFKKVANQYTDLLSTYSSAGMAYRVDLRLRPDGRLGEVCISLDGARNYYQTRGRDWELQMLIKARPAAGEREPGRQLLEAVDQLIYSSTLDFSAVEAVSATRERIQEKLAGRKNASRAFDVKLAPGGIRDVEFLVQCLQRLHGGREPWVRHGGTLLALSRLRDKNLLSTSEYSRLSSAYQFLRHLEHRLQYADDRQTHSLPPPGEELDLIARRMPASEVSGEPNGENLLRRLNAHLEAVQEMYARVIHAQRPVYYTAMAPPAESRNADESSAAVELAVSNLVRFLDIRAPNLAAMLPGAKLRRGARHFEHFLEKIMGEPDRLKALDDDAVLAGYVLDLFEHSAYFAEHLIRNPAGLETFHDLRTGAPQLDYGIAAAALQDSSQLRQFFHRQMLRLQSESICLHRPIFPTLSRTSDLADSVIAAAYRMAIDKVINSRPPVARSYAPAGQMIVIALGRLGMREFDLASDADLVFVLADQDWPEHLFWTRVAEKMIDVLTAYTGEGVMFAVDTRLRPNGREGGLVQSESAYKEYFAKQAEAWEGITYMKSRAIAGNLERGTNFLNELQDVDWRRYGQSGRSQKQLRAMRTRLEKEQGPTNPLKAGTGGYYDIDFALMYLRLKGAGIFFKVLNTPQRIDVIEKMGHLERADAEFLRDAATFYRAVDHGMRVSSGHTEGSLPSSPGQLENLADLVTRWTPDHLHDQALPVELAQIRTRTREFFDRVFG